jgi:hypothetical protein
MRVVVTGGVRILCRVSNPTASSYLKQLALLGIVELTKGSNSGRPYIASLAPQYRWLNPTEDWDAHDWPELKSP